MQVVGWDRLQCSSMVPAPNGEKAEWRCWFGAAPVEFPEYSECGVRRGQEEIPPKNEESH